MEQVVRFSDAMQDGLSLDAQLAQVLEAAREVVPVDRLHLWALAPEGDRLLYVTGSGLSEEDQRALGKRPELRLGNGDAMARAIRQKVALLVNGRAPRRAPLPAVGAQSFYVLPVIARQRTLGLLVADNARSGAPLVPDRLRLLSTFAMHVATAVDNTWLLTELHKRDGTLTESLEQQGATAEILKVIATSPTDVQLVFDAIARSVTRLCGGLFGAVDRFDGELIHRVAQYNFASHAEQVVQQVYPMRPNRRLAIARAVLDGRVVHIPDVEADPEYDHAVTRAVGMRSTVAVPLLRQGSPIGAIGVAKAEPTPFSDTQIALLQTFADQAVIAIENTRLFDELQTRNRDLTEALEQQTATSEILRVISIYPTDLVPVFHMILEKAARLAETDVGVLWFHEGNGLMRGVAAYGTSAEYAQWILANPQQFRKPFYRAEGPWRTGQFLDVRQEAPYREGDPFWLRTCDTEGVRTLLAVPLIANDRLVGSFGVTRREVRGFSEKHVAVLRTFADQAVIAIENTRLFQELQERLEQQTATTEILRVISQSQREVQPVFEVIAANALNLCRASHGSVYTFDGELIKFAAGHSHSPETLEAVHRAYPMPPGRSGATARAILTRAVVYIPDVLEDQEYVLQSLAQAVRFRSAVSVPMLRDGHPIGAISVTGVEPAMFSERQIALLRTFADQAVIAIENTRLFNELQERLEQQTATSDILRVISSSPTDIQPVLDAVAESAARLCAGNDAVIYRIEGDFLRPAAKVGPLGAHPLPLSRKTVTGRAVIDACTVHVEDILEHLDSDFTETRPFQALVGFRTTLASPLRREGVSIGAILIRRMEVRPFTASQIALLETFADQAVIAIENVRLFTELQERNKALTESLQQQTATSEILRVISSSPNDLTPVFDSILESATRLCEAQFGMLGMYDGAAFNAVAMRGVDPTVAEQLRVVRPGPHNSLGRLLVERRPVHIADVTDDNAYRQRDPVRVATVELLGARTFLAVPLLKEDAVAGALVIYRREVRPFSDSQIGLVKTFADQAVIAIENVRLFKELETRNRDLTEALEQQTATSEILRVISRSPTDLQPVLDVVAESAARLCDASDAVIFRVQEGSLKVAAQYGSLSVPEEGLPLTREMASGRAVIDRCIVHVPDLLADSDAGKELSRRLGVRTLLVAPLLRENKAIGTITLRRSEVRAFSDKQIELLKTFADQAVIAIENTRLFNELRTRNQDLTEALEQQTATSEILRVISQSQSDVQPVFDTIAANARRLCRASSGWVNRFDGEFIEGATAHAGATPEALKAIGQTYPMRPSGGAATGRAILARAVVYVPDVREDPEYRLQGLAQAVDFRSIAAAPMIRDGNPIGAITVLGAKPAMFTERQIAMLQTFSDQAVIAIENTRLFNELQTRNRDLTEALEQQTATSEILRVISSSPTDLKPVLDAVAESAARLCDANDAVIFRVDGDAFRTAAHYGSISITSVEEGVPIRRDIVSGRAILERCVVHLADVLTEPDSEFAGGRAYAARLGYRTILAAPMLREKKAIGVLLIRRVEVRPFSDKQIELLKTFADQAVIAIENVRLFTELQERLEQQTATSEILRVISQSQRDVQPVFETIAANARNLCEATFAVVFRFDGELINVAAADSASSEVIEAIHRAFPMRPGHGAAVARAVLTRGIVYMPDVREDPEYRLQGLAQAIGYRSLLSIPMLRDGSPIGVITVAGAEPAMFTERQIAMLQTFADQAVIAIENTRLFNELESRNRALTESLEQQTATSEILRVISQSQRDVQPVFETIAANARKLCDGTSAWVLTFDGELIHLAAADGYSPEALEAQRQTYPMSPSRGGAAARAVLTRAVAYIPDVRDDPEYRLQSLALAAGYRSVLAVPMLRDGSPIGAITVTGAEPAMFSERQIAMLQTFSDQAVIAVENTRLFNELQTRNRDLTESLEQQTATSEILRVISESQRDVQPVFDAIAANARKLCEATFGSVWTYDGESIKSAAVSSAPDKLETLRRMFPTPPVGLPHRRAILTRAVVYVSDIREDPEYDLKDVAQTLGFRSVVSVPMLRDGKPIGTIGVSAPEAAMFSERQIAMLQTFADQAVIAIENTRLFNELQSRNRDLTESLEQQTATSEILRVISQSQADVQPVFETIAENARKLCEAAFVVVSKFDGELIYLAAVEGYSPEGLEELHRAFPMPPSRGGASARALLTRGVVYIPDVREDGEYRLQGLAQTTGFHSAVAVPMLRDGSPIGAISVAGAEPAMFTERQIAMLRTFADQAVIAIENTRLFNELQARTAELGRSVEELKALGEVGSAVSSTLDLDTVLTTILTHANQLAGTQAGLIYDYDEATEELRPRATFGYTQEIADALRRNPIRKGEGVTGQAVLKRQPVQIPDIAAEGAYDSRLRHLIMDSGFRALLAVPLIREDQVMGALAIARTQPGEFSPQVIELLTTFASQSALAMQNARLFHQLEIASQHKSTFLANMSHELRTPLNAIIGYSEMLQEDAVDEGAETLVPDLKRVNAAGKHLLELINSILDLSKIEAGKMELQLEDFDVAGMVDDIRAVIQPLAESNGNRLELVCDAVAGTMHADLTKVRQVLFNLLSNACKFTEQGTVSLAVHREESDGDAWLSFSVSDTGIGLSADQLGRLFQEFSQAHADAKRKYGGTGLGLALSRRLCRLMGGDIAVTSEAGKGSTFTLRLPVDVERIHEVSGHAAGSAGTVLVIDDEAVVRELMQRFLGKEGFRVLTAASGEDGLRLAREQRPDAVTLDVMMPGMDGWVVLSALTTDPELADIPVIMLTIVDDKKMGYALGASEYLTKPIDRARLVAVLTKYRRDLPVLVVDDDASIRQLLRRILEEEGYTVVEADNGRVALERLGEHVPGAILLDLMMPEMDGFEFLNALHGREAWRHIPVVIVTAKDLTSEEHERLNGSVVRILQKGAYAEEELLAEVRALVAASIGRRKGRSG